MADDTRVLLETEDAQGNPVTVFSREGKGRTQAEFATAITNYDSGKRTPGFDIMPKGMLRDIRAGYEAVNVPLQENAPTVGRAIGGAVVSGPGRMIAPLIRLAEKAGLIPPGRTDYALQQTQNIGGNIGEPLARIAAESVNTPEKAATTAATMAISPVLPSITTGVGGVSKLALLANALATGTAGAAGYEAGRQITSQPTNFGKTAVEFGVMAGAGLASSVIGHWITKYINPVNQEIVAQGIIDTLTAKNPILANNPAVLDIALSSPQKVASITQQMSKALVGDADQAGKTLVSNIKNAMPTLNVGEQSTLRAHVRGIVKDLTTQLDNITDKKAFTAAGDAAQSKLAEMTQFLKDKYPGIDISPTMLKIDKAVNNFATQFQQHQEGAYILAKLREAGAQGGLDLMKFAQLIKGEYQSTPGSSLEAIGKILRPGGSLTDLPLPGQTAPGSDQLTKVYNFLKDLSPAGKYIPSAGYKGPQVPWQAPAPALSPLGQIAVQGATATGAQQTLDTAERGNNAVKSFLNRSK